MHTEQCCQALLHYIIPEIDNDRKGLCIDVGVGTRELYCELFARIGFSTVAVEPLPTPNIINLCRSLGIVVFKSCLHDNNGTQTMYIGTYNGSENLNLSSTRSDWWGSSINSVQVPSMTFNTLLKDIKASLITCLKLDVEGVENIIIKQLQGIPTFLLPKIVMFEYGGGSTKQEGKGGWSESGINDTISSFRILKNLNYSTTILIDGSSGSKERIIDLAEIDILPENFFNSQDVYGNAICFHNRISDESWIKNICADYRDNDLKPPVLLAPMTRLDVLILRLRRVIRRAF